MRLRVAGKLRQWHFALYIAAIKDQEIQGSQSRTESLILYAISITPLVLKKITAASPDQCAIYD
jgi:hypothetical protein